MLLVYGFNELEKIRNEAVEQTTESRKKPRALQSAPQPSKAKSAPANKVPWSELKKMTPQQYEAYLAGSVRGL